MRVLCTVKGRSVDISQGNGDPDKINEPCSFLHIYNRSLFNSSLLYFASWLLSFPQETRLSHSSFFSYCTCELYPSAHLSVHPSFHPVCIFCLVPSLVRDTVFYSSLCPHTSQHRVCSVNDYNQNLLYVISCLFTHSLFILLLFSCSFVSDSSVP